MERPKNIVEVVRNPWVRIAIEAASLVFAVWLLHRLSGVLTPLLVGLILAYMLDPLVTWLTRRHLPRHLATTAVFGTGALLLAATLAIGLPILWQQGSNLYRVVLLGDAFKDLPDAEGRLDGAWQPHEPLLRDLNGNRVYDPSHLRLARAWLVKRRFLQPESGHSVEFEPNALSALDPEGWLKAELSKLTTAVQGDNRSILNRVTSLFGALGWWALALLLVPIYGYFFSLNLPHVSRVITSHIPLKSRERTLRILAEIHVVVGAFFRGRVVICAILGALACIGFTIAEVRGALLLGICLGIGTAIPLAAGLVLIPVGILLYLSDASAWQYWLCGGTYVAIQALEPVLISVIMGKGVEMHPVLIVVAILAFGSLLGAVGVLLAVPLAATARILMREFIYPHVRRLAGLDETTVMRLSDTDLALNRD